VIGILVEKMVRVIKRKIIADICVSSQDCYSECICGRRFEAHKNNIEKILRRHIRYCEVYKYNNTLVSGITCKTCKFVLPTMTMTEHLDKNNIKNKCLCR
jgi:hypothetical protein